MIGRGMQVLLITTNSGVELYFVPSYDRNQYKMNLMAGFLEVLPPTLYTTKYK